jgi:hypothetical protein
MSTQPQLGLRAWPLVERLSPITHDLSTVLEYKSYHDRSANPKQGKNRGQGPSQNMMQGLLSCAHRAVVPATAAASFVSASSRRLSLATAVRLAGERSADDGPSEILPLNSLGRSATAVWPALARQRRGIVALANTPVGATFCLMQHRTLHASAAVAAAPKPKGQKREEDLPPPPADDEEVSV